MFYKVISYMEKPLFVALFCILGFTAACSDSATPVAQLPTLAVLPSLTFTPVPTATLRFTPTDTPTPSITPTPSNTFTPTLTPSQTLTPEPPCDAQTWWDAVDPIIVEFLDTAEIAGQTSRVSLSPIVLEMRRIYRRYEDVEYPSCIRQAYFDLLFGMDYAVDGFGDFQMEYDGLMELDFGFANERLHAAALYLYSKGIFADVRLAIADTIWGGRRSNEMTATALRFTATPTATETPAGKAHP